jgi:hypothetical protein
MIIEPFKEAVPILPRAGAICRAVNLRYELCSTCQSRGHAASPTGALALLSGGSRAA